MGKAILYILVLMADLAIVIYGLYTIFFSLIGEGSRVIKIRHAIIITVTILFPAFYFWVKLLAYLFKI